MARSLRYAYTVRPMLRFTRFPVDMLRYDQAWPSDPKAVDGIECQPQDRPDERIEVRLVSVSRPTIDRWVSMGWNVVDLVEVRV